MERSGWKLLGHDFYGFLRKNREAILGIGVVALLVYGFAITHFTLGSDEEIEYMYNHYDWSMVRFGRFFYAVLDELLHTKGTFVPFVDTFLAVSLLACAAVIFLFVFQREDRELSQWEMILFSGAFLAVPFFSAAVISISGYNMILNIAVCMMAVAVLLSKEWIQTGRKEFLVISILLVGIAEGVYQSMITVYISGVILCLLLSVSKDESFYFRKYLSRIGKYIIVAISGMAVYFIINWLFQTFVFPSNGYSESFFGWGKGPAVDIMKSTISSIWFLLRLDQNFGAVPAVCSLGMLLLVCLWRGIRKKSGFIIFIPILGIFAVISPFFLVLAAGSAPVPIRTVQALPLIVGFAWLYLLRTFRKSSLLRGIAIALGCLFVLIQAQGVTRILYGDHLRYEQDVNTATLINYDIERYAGGTPEVPVIFVGAMPHQYTSSIVRIDVIGVSFFALNGGSNLRIHAFMRHQGFVYKAPTVAQMQEIAPLCSGMPSWPVEGSVVDKDGVLVVKLGETTDVWYTANNIPVE